MGYHIYHGNCIEVAPMVGKVQCIVTDCPYELNFMSRKWDGTGISFDPNTWKVMLNCVPPGGHMLCFGGSRTFHRIACAIEDAGWELRDTLMWIYGSGFPKSHSIPLAIDKESGHSDRGHRIATASRTHPDGTFEPNGDNLPAYEPRSDAAKAWEGYGTALKPAFEPIILARRPLEGTIASNVLKRGVGGINVDAARIGTGGGTGGGSMSVCGSGGIGAPYGQPVPGLGRFPSNVILDEETAREMDAKYGVSTSSDVQSMTNKSGRVAFGKYNPTNRTGHSDSGGISRYFYIAKASRAERDAGVDRCRHPTVKPVMLMRHLIRLVCPPGGTVLDPFCGSGTTGIACQLEGMHFIGIEQSAEYVDLAWARIEAWRLHLPDAVTDSKDPRQLEIS